jgi:hypothetical protein
MARMARGLAPRLGLSRWWSLVVGFATSFAFNPLRLLAPRRSRRTIPERSAV